MLQQPKPGTPLLPRNGRGLGVFYDSMHAERGMQLPPHLFPVCRALMDYRIRKLMIIVGPGSGKSMLLSQTYPAFEIGHDPTTTILGLSAGEALMQGFQKGVMEWIDKSEIYHRLFPGVLPDKEAGWSTERGMYVTGRLPGDPDASYFAAGLTSSALTGKHGRIILIDDIHNKENAASSLQCQNVKDTYYNTIIGRADPRGARFIVAGRRWRDDDVYAHLKEMGDFVVMELPAEREGTTELFWEVTIPDGMTTCFNEQDFNAPSF